MLPIYWVGISRSMYVLSLSVIYSSYHVSPRMQTCHCFLQPISTEFICFLWFVTIWDCEHWIDLLHMDCNNVGWWPLHISLVCNNWDDEHRIYMFPVFCNIVEWFYIGSVYLFNIAGWRTMSLFVPYLFCASMQFYSLIVPDFIFFLRIFWWFMNHLDSLWCTTYKAFTRHGPY